MRIAGTVTEEIVRVLALAGIGVIHFTLPLAIALIGVLAIVVMSYHQVIKAYPSGGGGYVVSRQNLGETPGLVAAAALMIDYILTVAVSVAAGVQALTSVFPELYPYRIGLSLLAIAILAMGNLRGIRESGTLFAIPIYVYLVAILSFLGYGMFRLATDTLPAYTPPAEWIPATTGMLSILLILRAFSAGAVALTGVEAISNGVPAFKAPEPRNARITLTWMALLFAVIFLGMSLLTSQLHLLPDPTEKETLISTMVRVLIDQRWIHLVIQFSIAILLLIAANTAFAGFPRLSFILARDDYMPRTFARRGERLAFSTGILVLAALSGLFIIIFQSSVSALIPLYTVGVFAAFTLTQMGMVRHWRRTREKGWKLSSLINGTGAIVTGVIVIEAVSVKFIHGAWMVILLIPLLVMMMRSIRAHYARLETELLLEPGKLDMTEVRPQLVVVPVAALNKPFAEALAYARDLSSNVTCIHVAEGPEQGEEFRRRWKQLAGDTPLVVIESPYRNFLSPLLAYVDNLHEQNPGYLITVVIPEFWSRRWWEHLLHSHSALRMKRAFLSRPNIVVVDIPYHLQS